ncbi:MAG: phosphoserine phosphatase SerB, partial [Lautropia sp.]
MAEVVGKMRLVLQHPGLAASAVDAFAAGAGAPPSLRETAMAVWEETVLDTAAVAALARRHRVDAALVPSQARLADYRLLAFDMDSTLITIECVDEIASFA